MKQVESAVSRNTPPAAGAGRREFAPCFVVGAVQTAVRCRDIDVSQVLCMCRVRARAVSVHRTVPRSVPGCRHRSCPDAITDRATVPSKAIAGRTHVAVTMASVEAGKS